MTNEKLILNERFRLMAAGKIGTTGRKVMIYDGSVKKELPEPEEIHTFAAWKSLGYSVKKGQKAISRLTIWKHTGKAPENAEDEPIERMFRKEACFFSSSQVERLA